MENLKLRNGLFHMKDSFLHCEEIDLNSLDDLAKVDHITPCFVYSKNQLLQNINLYKKLESTINCDVGFSMKANHNPEILKIFLDQGLEIKMESVSKLGHQTGFY